MGVSPDVVVTAIVGLATAAAAYLAGRNKHVLEGYKALVADLHDEIDRLKAEVKELRTLVSELMDKLAKRSRSSRQS